MATIEKRKCPHCGSWCDHRLAKESEGTERTVLALATMGMSELLNDTKAQCSECGLRH